LVTRQGRNLASAIVFGLVLGAVTAVVTLNGVPLIYFLLQNNAAVYAGNFISLFTSLIVVTPDLLGASDALLNAVSVIFVDSLLSSAYSYREYFATFLATGLAGNLASLLNGPYITSFGASGGIFGLVAGAVAHDYALQGRLNPALLGWFLIIFFLNTFTNGYVDWLAHTGGALVGLGIGYALGLRHRSSCWYRTSPGYQM
jgi:membrane associated rhomboid family serine protease